jgi:hypothetical protein
VSANKKGVASGYVSTPVFRVRERSGTVPPVDDIRYCEVPMIFILVRKNRHLATLLPLSSTSQSAESATKKRYVIKNRWISSATFSANSFDRRRCRQQLFQLCMPPTAIMPSRFFSSHETTTLTMRKAKDSSPDDDLLLPPFENYKDILKIYCLDDEPDWINTR